MKKTKIYYILSFILLAITAIFGSIYRNYIYINKINDYGFADIHPNICAVIVASFLFMGYMNFENKVEEFKIILEVCLGFIIYEIIQATPLIGTFDWYDIIGTIIGTVITIIIYLGMNRFSRLKNM